MLCAFGRVRKTACGMRDARVERTNGNNYLHPSWSSLE